MSCSCRKKEETVTFYKSSDNCICSFPTLIILILIILQFSKRDKKEDCYEEDHGYYHKDKKHDDHYDDDDKEDCDKDYREDKQVDRGILFIIALFFLACAGCGKGFRSSCGC